jgi:hypothetical protein
VPNLSVTIRNSFAIAVSQFPGVPLVLGGFSFGGPTVWAVARQLQVRLSRCPNHDARCLIHDA